MKYNIARPYTEIPRIPSMYALWTFLKRKNKIDQVHISINLKYTLYNMIIIFRSWLSGLKSMDQLFVFTFLAKVIEFSSRNLRP